MVSKKWVRAWQKRNGFKRSQEHWAFQLSEKKRFKQRRGRSWKKKRREFHIRCKGKKRWCR